ncbi:hypothetical protein GE061_008973 [Apolygus lucorum]|uniref:Uncharacterized protein n=1 Tax=Apolygus lucorum TaxID=248454 RepID=A0A8S9Y064_APOLU|nr:hypothetical protein GE061_008973 [Apolygus lucorum]
MQLEEVVKIVTSYLNLPDATFAAHPPAGFNLEAGHAAVRGQWPSPFEQREAFLTAVFPRLQGAAADGAQAGATGRQGAAPAEPAEEEGVSLGNLGENNQVVSDEVGEIDESQPKVNEQSQLQPLAEVAQAQTSDEDDLSSNEESTAAHQGDNNGSSNIQELSQGCRGTSERDIGSVGDSPDRTRVECWLSKE